jgi:acyl-coenzyme A synthetase/AMP-(fatty) acid ligase
MRCIEQRPLRSWLDGAAHSDRLLLSSIDAQVPLGALARGSSLDIDLVKLRERSVLIATHDQLTTALALIELDGVARRLTLLPPDFPREHVPTIVAKAEIDATVSSEEMREGDVHRASGVLQTGQPFGLAVQARRRPQITPVARESLDRRPTEWVMFTSGTTGVPKMVVHSLAGLTAAITRRERGDETIVWSTFYDIRRYGGLQILLRAILDGGSMVLSDAREPVGDYLARLGRHGVTHMSGTPSHWRRVLMSPQARAIAPRSVRLSGEIADQAILDNLRAVYAPAPVVHAYASTEAGVCFEVKDGLEGFPASVISAAGEVEIKIADGTLRIRSPRTAKRYLGEAAALTDADGFIDTGDMLELRGERYYFAGRHGGIINVGGLKVHPEEVEAVINGHPQVRMSLVLSRKNPITGAIVVADVVLIADAAENGAARIGTLRSEIMELCRARLPQHKVPAMIRFVPSLNVAASGKLERPHA